MSETTQNSAQQNGTILIADDSLDAISILRETLSGENYNVFIAMDGLQAVDLAEQIHPDLILMDAIMPQLDGFEACRIIKQDENLKDIPVIFMTGLSDSEHVVMGLEAGGVDYVSKPVNHNELLARINVHIKTSKAIRSIEDALNEVGQKAFATNAEGKLLWSTKSAQSFISDTNLQAWFEQHMPKSIYQWLKNAPEKYAHLRIQPDNQDLQIRYLSRPRPGEYLFQFQVINELHDRGVLQEEFSLTEREAEVLYWLSQGKTNREIGVILSMSPRTVNKHLESVYPKLEVDNRTSATAKSLQRLAVRT